MGVLHYMIADVPHHQVPTCSSPCTLSNQSLETTVVIALQQLDLM